MAVCKYNNQYFSIINLFITKILTYFWNYYNVMNDDPYAVKNYFWIGYGIPFMKQMSNKKEKLCQKLYC